MKLLGEPNKRLKPTALAAMCSGLIVEAAIDRAAS